MLTRNDSWGRSVHTRPAPIRMPTASTIRPMNSQERSVRWSGSELRPARWSGGMVPRTLRLDLGSPSKIERRALHYNVFSTPTHEISLGWREQPTTRGRHAAAGVIARISRPEQHGVEAVHGGAGRREAPHLRRGESP